VSGAYEFKDGLKYDAQAVDAGEEGSEEGGVSWKYCTPKDRRFYREYTEGVKPAGESLFSNNTDETNFAGVPEGSYDVGDGYIDPSKDSSVRKYGTGKILRPAQAGESKWAQRTCRRGIKRDAPAE